MSGPATSVTPNPLAGVLAATIRELVAARQLHAAERDFTSWLQTELCRARGWTMVDVLTAWHDELDRRAHFQANLPSRRRERSA